MELIKTFKDRDYEIHNHIKIEGGNYVHKQVEKRDGRTFMRIKSRRLFQTKEILNTRPFDLNL